MFKKVGEVKIEIADMQVQKGSTDCGVFATAVATTHFCMILLHRTIKTR